MSTIVFDRSGGLISIKVDTNPATYYSADSDFRLIPTGIGSGFTVLLDKLILIETASADTIKNGTVTVTGTAEQKIAALGTVFVSGSEVINRIVLAANVINNDATPDTIADVTGLSFPVVAGSTYKFKFFIVYTSAATTTGSLWAINGPAAPTVLAMHSSYSLTNASLTQNEGISTYDDPATSNASSSSGPNIAIMEGIIIPSVDGTVIARFASEVAASAITALGGVSYVEYQQIA